MTTYNITNKGNEVTIEIKGHANYADEDYIATDFGEVIITNDNKVLLYT